jgi:hypothetical protein
MTGLHNLLYPRSCYQGGVKPENLVFNANIAGIFPACELYLRFTG